MRLFSYTIRYDYGSAPNPYWGMCTLTICKPVIRRTAKKNDWVVGLRGNLVVYAMKIGDRKTLTEYDRYCCQQLRKKIPAWSSRDFRRRVGDCIYDYSFGRNPKLRRGIHGKDNMETDLSGINALLSEDFYYFGSKAIALPTHLSGIIQKRGHKSTANDPFTASFIRWIRRHRYAHNRPLAYPELKRELESPGCQSNCSNKDREEAEADNCRVRRSKCHVP
jgi:hypothetical protein